MTTPPTVAPATSRDRIVHEAGSLFAAHGYDATSTRTIADAVGLNIATVAYHVGSKSDLYREVMRRAHEAQRDAVAAAATDLRACEPTAEDTRRALRQFVDAYVDFCLCHPEVPALWMRRWLSDGPAASDFEQEFIGPLVAGVGSLVQEVVSRVDATKDTDVDLLVYTIVWTVHSFCRAGIVDGEGHRVPPDDGANLVRFRRHLHGLVDATLALP